MSVDHALYVGKLPGRKRACLYYLGSEYGSVITPLAWFVSDEAQAEFLNRVQATGARVIRDEAMSDSEGEISR